jgi:signal transduction histidine kinase
MLPPHHRLVSLPDATAVTAPPRSPAVQRTDQHRGTNAAWLSLVGVVVCLAVFSVFAAYTIRTQVDRAERAQLLHDSYEKASSQFLRRERSELAYVLEPSADRLALLTAANTGFAEDLEAIAARGDPADGRLVAEILAVHRRYLAALEGLITAAAAGDAAEAHRIEDEVLDPIVEPLLVRIEAARADRAAEAGAAFAVLSATAQWTLILSPLVFAIGLALVLALWRRFDQNQRATRDRYREIEDLSRLRAEFVATVSHEFRTPLTGIQGFSELMRDEELSRAEVKEYAADINTDARRLARLISDMLDLDRMESGGMALHLESVDLGRLLADTVDQFRLADEGHPITLRLDERVPVLRADPDRLTQVVTNLLGNAIKYSPSGGAIELQTRLEKGVVLLTISDHGSGIPAEQLEKIFDRYVRVESAATHAVQGTGLGLSIVRQIVQRHAGRVWATSVAGNGSTFHVELPLPDPAGAVSVP